MHSHVVFVMFLKTQRYVRFWYHTDFIAMTGMQKKIAPISKMTFKLRRHQTDSDSKNRHFISEFLQTIQFTDTSPVVFNNFIYIQLGDSETSSFDQQSIRNYH